MQRDSEQPRRLTLPVYDRERGGPGPLTIQRALMRFGGVKDVYVCPVGERVCVAYVEYDPKVAQPADLCAVVERVGFRSGTPHVL